MTGPAEVILGQLEFGQMLIEKFTTDLADAEYFKPAVDEGNHVCWLLGHIADTEDWVVSMLTSSQQQIPHVLHELFEGGSTCLLDGSRYPSRREVDDLFRSTRARTVATLQSFDQTTWENQAPQGAPIEYFPTVASLWNLVGTHQFWHLGQLTDCRRAMNKPQLLFAS